MSLSNRERKQIVMDLTIHLLIILLAILCIGITVIVFFVATPPTEAVASVENNAEHIATFRAMVKADEERRYQEWLAKQEIETPLAIVPESEQKESTYLIEVSEEDIDLMARVVMSECSIYLSSPIGTDIAQAIAQTIVNRVRDEDFGNTVKEVVYLQNAYSTADNGQPTGDCYKAVYAALTYEAFPLDMFYFREGKYHDFGSEYLSIGNTYFSCR